MQIATYFNRNVLEFNGMLYSVLPDGKEDGQPIEGDWSDEEDEDFDDEAGDNDAMDEIFEEKHPGEVAPGDDDHLPEEELQ